MLLLLGVIALSLGLNFSAIQCRIGKSHGCQPDLNWPDGTALQTSLPELAACGGCAYWSQWYLCGQHVGSNLFNLLLIGGGVAAINPIPVARQLLYFEMPSLIVLTLGLVYFFKTGHTVTRKKAAVWCSIIC